MPRIEGTEEDISLTSDEREELVNRLLTGIAEPELRLPSGTSKPSNPKDAVGINKAPASVVSQLVMMQVNLAMMEGALKYGRHNYRDAGVRASVYYDATRRHMDSWWEGQNLDPDSKLNHIIKAIASLTVLADGIITGLWEDDRPPTHPELDAILIDLNAKAKALQELYGNVKPEHITQLGQAAKGKSLSDTRKNNDASTG